MSAVSYYDCQIDNGREQEHSYMDAPYCPWCRIAELEAENQRLREVTLELANDVEAYADADRCDRFAYPHIMAKWEGDMEPVRKARALLQEDK